MNVGENDTETTQGDHVRSTYYANKLDANIESSLIAK